MFVAVPTIIVPLTFGLQMSCANANNNLPYRFSTLFEGFKVYFTPKFKGCYGTFQAVLKFAIAYIACTSIAIVILVIIYSFTDPAFIELVMSAAEASSLEDIEALSEQILNYNDMYFIETSAALFGGTYLFMHHIMSTSIRAAMALYTPVKIDMNSNKVMHRITFKTFRKQYYKDYYASNWFFIVIFVLGYVSGLLFAYYIVSTPEHEIYIEQAHVIAMAIPFIISLPFFPLFFDSIELLYKRHSKDYEKASIKGVMDNIDEILKDKGLTPEEKAMLDDFVKKQEELKNKSSTPTKEDKEDDSTKQ